MLATGVIIAGLALLLGAGWLIGRVGREWTHAIDACREALGGELTPGNLLLPPRLWYRTDDGLSLVIGLSSSGEGGRRISMRTAGGARALVASTRLTVDGDGLPGDLRIRPAGAVAEHVAIDARRVATGITDFDRRVDLEGSVSAVLSRVGIERRAAIAAAVAQGASLTHGVWAIERAEPITRAPELIGLARLLLAAARATQAGETIAEERLYASVKRDPEPAFRLACLTCLVTRAGSWRARAIDAGLADPEAEIRLCAAQAAGAGGRNVLVELARTAPDDIRVAAIETLARDDGPEVRALLEELALAGTLRIRAAALDAVGRLAYAPVELLVRFARHPDPGLRVRALRALRPDAGAAVEQALLALDDDDPEVVRSAVDILGGRGDVRVLPRLQAIRVGPLDSTLRAAVERAIRAITDRPVPANVGGLALAGPDRPEAGRLGLDDDYGHLSDSEHGAPAAPVTDLFADTSSEIVAPRDLFEDDRAAGEVSPVREKD